MARHAGRAGRVCVAPLFGVALVLAVLLAGCSLVGDLLPPGPLMSREQAIAAAMAAEPGFTDDQVIAAQLGTWAEFQAPPAQVEGPQRDPLDPVWLVNLGWQIGPMNGQGVILLIDARDGHVIQRSHWIS